MPNERVLLVDDEVEFVETLAERLRSRGLEVSVAFNGSEGLEQIKTTAFDAVVLDFAMPGMDGVETLKAMLEARPEIQVMLLTGQATIKAAVEATRLGAVDVLEKPTDIVTLLEKIREARAKHIRLKEKKSEAEVQDILKKYGW